MSGSGRLKGASLSRLPCDRSAKEVANLVPVCVEREGVGEETEPGEPRDSLCRGLTDRNAPGLFFIVEADLGGGPTG